MHTSISERLITWPTLRLPYPYGSDLTLVYDTFSQMLRWCLRSIFYTLDLRLYGGCRSRATDRGLSPPGSEKTDPVEIMDLSKLLTPVNSRAAIELWFSFPFSSSIAWWNYSHPLAFTPWLLKTFIHELKMYLMLKLAEVEGPRSLWPIDTIRINPSNWSPTLFSQSNPGRLVIIHLTLLRCSMEIGSSDSFRNRNQYFLLKELIASASDTSLNRSGSDANAYIVILRSSISMFQSIPCKEGLLSTLVPTIEGTDQVYSEVSLVSVDSQRVLPHYIP